MEERHQREQRWIEGIFSGTQKSSSLVEATDRMEADGGDLADIKASPQLNRPARQTGMSLERNSGDSDA